MTEINKSQDISEGIEAAQMHFETGVYFEEEDFENAEDFQEYCEYLEYGPVGFCEEFEDVLNLDPDFVREYGGRYQCEIDETESEKSNEEK